MGASQTLPSPPRPHTSFSSLPIEIRLEIWKLTLTPRILCLHIHRLIAPPIITDGYYMDAFLPTLCVSFAATVLPHGTTPDQVFQAHTQLQAGERGRMAFGGSLGPVALYVCQESRAIAKQRYSLAFGGTDCALPNPSEFPSIELPQVRGRQEREELQQRDAREWKRKQLSEKRVWIDYEHDVLVVDNMDRPALYWKCSPKEPFMLLKKYAAEECKRVRNLAVGDGGTNVQTRTTNLLVGQTSWPYPQRPATLEGFTALRNIWLDDSFGTAEEEPKGSPVRDRFVNSAWSLRLMNAARLNAVRRAGENGMQVLRKEDFEVALTKVLKDNPTWSDRIPNVRVVRRKEWKAGLVSLSLSPEP